jgi:3-dehydrosphinganine reductase
VRRGAIEVDFRGQHAIVTGGSSGIGRGVACLLAQRGAHVSLIARRQELLDETLGALEDLRQSPGQRFGAFSADVSSWEQALAAISVLTAGDQPPDLLINAAGIVDCGYFQESSMRAFYDTMEIDLYGTVHTTKAVLPMMMERRRGHIVNFSSVLGFAASFGYTAYCAAKFAVRGFSDALRHEMKPYGIHVSVVFPQDTDTPQLYQERRLQPPEARRISEGANRLLDVQYVARTVLRGIERRQPYILPGLEVRLFFPVFNGFGWLTQFVRWYLIDRVVANVCRERGV